MNLRYLIESAIFFMAMIIFQIEVSAFNKDLHISVAEVQIYSVIKEEIIARGGSPYDGDSHHILRYLGSDSLGHGADEALLKE